MKNLLTNWSTPKTNFFHGINDLRKALNAGQNAILVKEYNENCKYPILNKKTNIKDLDFREYEFFTSLIKTKNNILKDNDLSEIDKYLTLNYVTKYGSKEAVDHYYKTGELTSDNDKGIGVPHLINVKDYINLLTKIGDNERATMYTQQYLSNDHINKRKSFNFYVFNHNNSRNYRKFNKKLWVVELHKPDKNVSIKKIHSILIKLMNFIFKKYSEYYN